MKISVVIPTFERADILKLTLESLIHQTLKRDEYEVIVVDDGSNDDGTTKDIVEEFQKKNSNFKYIWQENQKQGAARNNGIKHTEGEIVLFIGDDIIPAQTDFLEQHLRLHEAHPEETYGVLGFTDWHPDLKQNGQISDFMKWLTNGSCVLGRYGGHQFAYEKLKKGPGGIRPGETNGAKQKETIQANYNFFYTSNISLKRSLLLKEQFDKDFGEYGWEDIELGYRLEKKYNFKLLYNPQAIGWHHHVITEESLAPRMRKIAESAYIIDKKYPELKKIPSKKKILAFKLLSNSISLQLLKFMSKMDRKWLNYFYYALSKKFYLEGLKRT
ncbi:glycosyltransferase family 2 protein [Candidatus Peregrinibacteria bacterium]|jgi:glycosyltransferase involved in cell wall biosynthesis|nr:glycosyltransferase family 2 protein [Candidatus Peregrinibacteria bacterium]